ncbi:beta-eliminating lyase-related protein [Sphingomonas naphthae]|uniref:Beta-eliminating lyase-related protein n=1 Tax=Sphingomonas naphthae TaxID=1813468 RepID=A0ABY7TGL3_9SPHN|nr:beta-eliminating lyase-related protein [Sphingomonas naphthae]WCT71862.1 beta-eliminating lyase-related protein [Sphingomonas naphthae]
MRFFSDNAATVHPAVLEALAAAQPTDAAYDGDAISGRLDAAFSDLFGRDVAALWIATGTAANSIALATLCPPHGGVICHHAAHIQNDECGAPEFYTHGAKLLLADGPGAKLDVAACAAVTDAIGGGVHWVQPHALSITNATEYGMSYAPDEVAALGEWAKAKGLGFHMDGARFANAIVHHGCTPAAMTWEAGVDVLSFGFVKNGGLSAEALIFFNPDLAKVARIRRKRGGHLLSKGRFMAAQLLAMLADDIWLANARAANAGTARLASAAGQRALYPVEANELFLRLTADEAAGLRVKGFDFYDWAAGEARLVVSWDQPEAEIAALADALALLP